MNLWIYLMGEVTGVDIKIGHSKDPTMKTRVATVNGEQTTNARYVLLAGIRGDTKDEKAIHRYFASQKRDDKGSRTEYFYVNEELAEYANWLRQWWWVAIDMDERLTDLEACRSELWLPGPERRLAPDYDPTLLIQRYTALEGPLAGTVWDWMLSPQASFQDYFTPPEIVQAAREAMGDIDLDAAGHPAANRVHRIPDFFHVNRSAFEHDWYGRVWLNPPYGNNGPWFDVIIRYLDIGTVTQLCMLSPVWVFNTEIARPFMERTSAMVLLSPTPKFWGNSEGRTGTNNPHAIVYVGDRVDEFHRAFAEYGIPFSLNTTEAVA